MENSTVPKGSLVEIIDGYDRKEIQIGRSHNRVFMISSSIDALLVVDLNYLNEVMNKIERWWNMPGWDSIGYSVCKRKTISIGSIGLYLGSLNVYDPFFSGKKEVRVCRAVLLEKSVYIIPANCVKWVQGLTKPQKAANNNG